LAAGGRSTLRDAGLEVELGLLEDDAIQLNRAWNFAHAHGRPFVTWKFAATLDGRSAATDGSSRWVTSPAARRDTHVLRALCDSILVGTNTVAVDNPQLTVRDAHDVPLPTQPLRVVVGERDLPEDRRVFDDQAETVQLRTHDPLDALTRLYHDHDRHHVFFEGGPRLAAAFLKAGVVDEPFDVFHLRMEEVREIADVEDMPAAQVERLRSLVRARAAKRAELAGVPMLDPARVFPSRNRGDALVTGTPAGSGTATGTARIIREAADFHRLNSGDVLVCPYTNPSWTPLFQRAAAVVVDTGAAASHAAIVAREYGIPAVMGTGTGTSVLADGERVTVDGGTGRVTRAS
jgi:phosphohistidine swiveling domain-containing protein